MEPTALDRRGLAPNGGVSPAQLREAERGLRLMLARKFSAVWIAENAKDILGQAGIEYAEWLASNPPARNPVGWLLTCAYRRALNLFDTQNRRPRPVSLDEVFQLADEATPTPEQETLEHDRQSRIREALAFLPPKECELLALVYFEDLSIREAGRKVGWQKSAADRHHAAALERMRALIGDRSLLSPANLGLSAWVLAKGEGNRHWRAPLESALVATREIAVTGTEALSAAAHRGAELWRRAMPFSEPASPLAASGAGRAAGYCGAAVGAVVCGFAATGTISPPLLTEGAHPPAKQRAAIERPVAHGASVASASGEPAGSEAGSPKTKASAPRAKTQQHFAPASTQQTVQEFGIESGSGEPASTETTSGGSSSSVSSSRPAPAPRSQGSSTSAEFGL